MRSEQCDRARRWASLELDGELSELGRVRLQAHVESCAECAAYARNAAAATRLLRAEPLAVPTREIGLPSRRRFPRSLQVAAAALAIGVAVGLGSVAGSFSGPPRQHASAAAVEATQQPYLERQLLALDTKVRERFPHGRMIPI